MNRRFILGRLTILLSFIISSSVLTQEYQNWKWLNELPQGNTLRWVKVWDADNWYAVGLNGTFMKTTDGGSSWFFHHLAGTSSSTGGTNTRYAAHFFDMNNGITVGAGGFTHTTDGGQTFDTLGTYLPSTTWYNIYFLDNNIGYAVGTSGRMAKTVDGGLTWSVISAGTTTLYDVYSPNDTLFIIPTTSGNIRRSTDGGASFNSVATGQTFTAYKVAFKDADNGWVTGSAGKALYTTDGGASWNNASTGLPSGTTFYDVDYVGPNQVVLTGDLNYLYTTSDNGATWNTLEFRASQNEQPFSGIYYSTAFLGNNFVTVGSNGLINSSFNSTVNVHTSAIKIGFIYDIWSDGLGKIITVGSHSVVNGTSDQILLTTDDGTTWVSGLTNTTASAFRSLKMLNADTGFTVGNFSSVYRTTNGGLSWDSLTTDIVPNQDLHKIDFVNSNVGWIFANTANDTGTIWKTTDAGISWIRQSLTGQTGNSTKITGAHMINENLCWALSAKPAVFKTNDGGVTWVEQPLPDAYTGTLNDIYMVNENVGFVVAGIGTGNIGRFYKTTDGGQNWNQDPLLSVLPPAPAVVILHSVQFADTSFGVISGTSGITLYTSDGGVTWQLFSTGSASTLYSIYFPPTGSNVSVYTGGANGNMLIYPNLLIPVELVSFIASVSNNEVTLNWITATETNNQGFALERKTHENPFQQIGFIKGKGTSTQLQSYQFTDKVGTGKYTYRLKQIDFDGSITYSKEIDVDVSSPIDFSLEQNYPNPFNPSTTIKFSMPVDGFVKLSVFNLLGEKVAMLVNENLKAGSHEVYFDASSFANGVYLYRIESGKFIDMKKMIILK